GGSKGLAILTTIGQNKAAIAGVVKVAPELQQLIPFTPQLQALAAVPPSAIALVQPNAKVLGQLAAIPAPIKNYMTAHAAAVQAPATQSPSQWRTWYWICFDGIILFLISIPILRGRWRPRDARRDEEAHEAMVQRELEAMHA